MTEPVPSPHSGGLHLTLNADGRTHPLLNVATILVLLIGLVSFVLSLTIRNDPSADSIACQRGAAVMLRTR